MALFDVAAGMVDPAGLHIAVGATLFREVVLAQPAQLEELVRRCEDMLVWPARHRLATQVGRIEKVFVRGLCVV